MIISSDDIPAAAGNDHTVEVISGMKIRITIIDAMNKMMTMIIVGAFVVAVFRTMIIEIGMIVIIITLIIIITTASVISREIYIYIKKQELWWWTDIYIYCLDYYNFFLSFSEFLLDLCKLNMGGGDLRVMCSYWLLL